MATTIMAIDTISTLRTTVGAADQSIYLQGYYGINDGGEGSFTWSTTSTAARNTVRVTTPARGLAAMATAKLQPCCATPAGL